MRVTTSGSVRRGACDVLSATALERLEVEVLELVVQKPERRQHGSSSALVGAARAAAQLLEAAPVAGAGAGERPVEGRLAVAPGLHLRRLTAGLLAVQALRRSGIVAGQARAAPTSSRIWS